MEQPCGSAAQGQPGAGRPPAPGRWRRAWRPAAWRWAASAWLGLAAAVVQAAPACPGPPLRLLPLAPGLWWVPAAGEGDSGPRDRGHVSNLVVAREGAALWLLGSGPTPVFGAALACTLRRELGLAATDVVSPWPRPEAVLGLPAFLDAGDAPTGVPRAWAHEDVAAALRISCPGCVARLRERLGPAAADLGEDPIRVPAHRVAGPQGELGPWRWWRLQRAPGYPVTVWEHRASGWRFAPGLLWGSGVPDGRDADIAMLAASTRALAALPPVPASAGWLGEQGGPLPPAAAAEQAAYWQALVRAVHGALARGEIDDGRALPLDEGPGPAGISAARRAAWRADPRHALNGQRAWRQAEDDPEGWLQRSLR